MIAADTQSTETTDSRFEPPSVKPPAIVHRINLNDESISASLRGAVLTPENLNQEVTKAWAREQIAQALECIESARTPAAQAVHTIARLSAYLVSPHDHAHALQALSTCPPGPQLANAIYSVLSSLTIEVSNAWKFFGSMRDTTVGVVLSHLPTGGAKEVFAGGWISEELRGLASHIQDTPTRERLSAHGLTVRQLMEVLTHIPAEQKLSFLERLVSLRSPDSETNAFLLDKLDNALYGLSLEERTRLCNRALEKRNESALIVILQNAPQLSDLRALVDRIGVERLLSYGGEVRELTASIVLLSETRTVDFSALSERTSAEEIIQGLETRYITLQQILDTYPTLSHTQAFHDIQDTLASNRSALSAMQHSPQLDVLLTLVKESQLEFRFGVNLSHGDSDYLRGILSTADIFTWHEEQHAGEVNQVFSAPIPTNAPPRWTGPMLDEVATVLEGIPETDLIFSSMLHDIELVDTLGPGVLGARYHADGKIKIATVTYQHAGVTAAYDGKSSLIMVLAHEIGHGIQIGDGDAGLVPLGGGKWDFGNGEEQYDFDEFRALGGWQVIDQSRFNLGKEPFTVVLDGVTHPLGEEIEHQGKTMVLRYVQGLELLIAHNPRGEFSHDPYSQASPWEDFAEAFCEYLFLPERLIAEAPEKFKMLDQEFGKYRDDTSILATLQAAGAK